MEPSLALPSQASRSTDWSVVFVVWVPVLTSLRGTAPLLLSTVFQLVGVGLLHSHIAPEGRALGFSVVVIGMPTSARKR